MSNIEHNFGELKEYLTCLAAAIPSAILVRKSDSCCHIANNLAKAVFKLPVTNLHNNIAQDSVIYCNQCRLRDVCPGDEAVWNAGKAIISEAHFADESGNAREYEVHKTPVFKKNGERKWLVIFCRDITDIKLAEHDLRIANTAMESQEGIVITDASNHILRVNKSFTRLSGYGAEEVIGKTTAILKSGRHDKAFYQAMWKTLKQKKSWQGEIWDRRKNGEIYPKWLTITAVVGPGEQINNYVGAFTDLSEHKEAKDAIYRLAFYDPLTSLPNRRLLQDRMELALSNCARSQHYGAVLMIDLDNFKIINDTKGHAIGDLLLMEMAKRLKSCVREGDTVARLGGDEFIIMVEYLSNDGNQAAQQAETLSNKILKVCGQTFLISGEKLHCTLSIGISMFATLTTTVEEMLKHADVAMYQAKSAGRNTVRFFDPNLHALLEERQALISELYQALPNSELILYYQAQVDHKQKIHSAEVLLRWLHPQRGLVPPDKFIPLAEESGLIIPIGCWVLFEACQQLKVWEENPLTNHLTIAVNVSARQFNQTDFVEQVDMVLGETGANPSLLKIELTESVVLHDIASTIEKMEALKSRGIHFSIDDFGTGYSSLSYLRKLPISQLKIDQSFVREIDINESDAIIAQTIIGMAKNLGFNVIAEGVETDAQRQCIESYGCPFYQGYFFSKPVPLEEFEKLIY